MASEIREGGDRTVLVVDGTVVALVEHHDRGRVRALTHTETAAGFEGRGYAGELVGAVLAAMRRDGLGLLPYCPYVRHYLDGHPADVELVPVDRRAEFGL